MEFIKTIGNDILTQPAFLMGLISFIGLAVLKKPFNKILTGTLKPILGYLMLGVGAGVIVENLMPLGVLIENGFHIKGVVPNNEAIVAIAQTVLGKETMIILLLGLIFNILIARFTKFKYIFLTGHHSFFMAALLSAVLGTVLRGFPLMVLGGFFLGAWSAIAPAIGQRYTLKVTDGDEIAMGHFGSLGYYISAFVGKFVGKPEDSTEKMSMPESINFLRDTTIATAITMTVFYVGLALINGREFVETNLSNGTYFIIFAFTAALKFAVGVTVVFNGVRMILSELIPAFEGISRKLIPNSIPAVDCAVFFTYAPTAVIIGFIASFIGGVVGMFVLGALGGVLIIPGLIPHFFCGASAGIYGNATGGKKGAIVGSFIHGLIITFLPAMLLPVLGSLGFANTTFGDTDFAVIGIVIGQILRVFSQVGIYVLAALVLVVLIIPKRQKKQNG